MLGLLQQESECLDLCKKKADMLGIIQQKGKYAWIYLATQKADMLEFILQEGGMWQVFFTKKADIVLFFQEKN